MAWRCRFLTARRSQRGHVIAVHPTHWLISTQAFTSHPLDDARNLLMPVYGVLAWAGEPVGAEGQPLAWVTSEELGSDAYPMPPADYPLVDPVRQFLRRRERSGRRWRLVAPVRRLLRRRR